MAQTIYTQALSDADKKRLAAAMQHGAGAASSLALQMANTATGATSTPPLPTAGATTSGAVPAQVQTAQAQAQAARAQQEQQRALQQAQKAGDIQAMNSLLSAQTMQRSIDRAAQTGNTQLAAQMQQAQAAQARANAMNNGLNPYQAALANTVNLTGTDRNSYSGDALSPATQKALGTPQPAEQNKDYLFFGRQDPGFKLGMSDEDRASWDAIGAKYAAGDTSWNRDTNQFREDGNWSGYYDDNGNYNGWLRAVDGTGGYAPAFGGKVGETGYAAGTVFYAPDGTAYTMGADGSLRKSGNATVVRYGSYIGPKTGYQDSDFWALEDGQYKRYTNQTAPQEVLNAQGYYRDDNGLVRLMDSDYYIAQGLKNGQVTPEQVALAQAMKNAGNSPSGNIPHVDLPSAPNIRPTNYAEEYTSRTPTTNPVPTNNQPVQNTQPSQPTVTPGSYQPTPSDTVNIRGGDQNDQNIYQRYLDQWDYPDAPEWNGTDYERQRDELLANAMNPYEGSPYDQQRDDALAQYGEKWQGSEYQPKRDEALRRAEEMQWNYDPNTDPVWQALQKQYRREGDRATQEAMAQAAMRTGGLANSYAVTAASQAGDYYAAQLSDRLPQVYQDAYNRYLQEFQRQMGISDQYQGFDDREYSRWADQQGKNLDLADRYNQYGQQDYNRYMDRVSQQLQGADRYNQYGGTEYQRYMDRLGQYNTDRNFSYGRYRDAVGDVRYDDETQYDRAWNEEARDYSRAYQAQRDAILDNRADREWAQQLREYADAQNWKAAEWQQYLREYGDQLSEQERQWAYQMARDAVEDNRWERQYADQRSDTMYNRALQEDQTAYQRALYDQEYADQRGDTAWEQGYKQTAYNDEMERSALNYLNTNGIVTGRYAEILGVPDGTTYEQYYSRYLGGGSSSPFEETEIPSGTTPKYTPPPGGGDEGGGDETPNDPEYQKIRSRYGEDTAMEVWSLAGRPWYLKLKELAGRDSAAALDQIYSRYEAGEISENALEPLLDMLGLNMSSVTYKPSYRVTTVKGNRNGGSKGNNIQDIDNVRGR